MKILYAFQATGNGHLCRALELIPAFMESAEVDVFMSGIQSDVPFPYDVKAKKYGLSFIFGKNGNVDTWATMKSLRPITLIRDIFTANLKDYDLIVNDFEPVTAWAAKWKGMPCIGLSHQAAFLSDAVPRPSKRDKFAEMVLKHYAPSTEYIGIHFQAYDQNIRTPIIRSAIRGMHTSEQDFITVYLPSYGDDFLIDTFSKVRETRFIIFSKFAKSAYERSNVSVFPAGDENWEYCFANGLGVIMGGGFEGPAEALYLGKKMLIIPMINQYEQRCNARALQEMGVDVVNAITPAFTNTLKYWLREVKGIHVPYPDDTHRLVESVLNADATSVLEINNDHFTAFEQM